MDVILACWTISMDARIMQNDEKWTTGNVEEDACLIFFVFRIYTRIIIV